MWDLSDGVNPSLVASYQVNDLVDMGLGDVSGNGKANIIVASATTCGDVSHPYPQGDITYDCRVDLDDLATLSAHWLEDDQPTAP